MKFTKRKEVVIAMALALLIDINLIGISLVFIPANFKFIVVLYALFYVFTVWRTLEIFNGKTVSQEIAENLKKEVSSFEGTPKLIVTSVGNDPASMSYIKSKTKMATFIGIELEHAQFSEDVAEEVLVEAITQFNNDERVNGIILQLPLPEHLNASKLSSLVRSNKDVDGFSSANMGKLSLNQPHFIPCTPLGILDIWIFTITMLKARVLLSLGVVILLESLLR